MRIHLRALFRPRHLPMVLAVASLIALGAWLAPRRIEGVALVAGGHRWLAEASSARRQIVWQPADELTDLVPPRDPPDSLSHPHWAHGGTTLYFTLRRARGDADLYRARWIDGRWEVAVPLVELNTPADEVGVSVAHNGEELYLASNRPGGQGGFDLYVSRRTKAGWGLPRNLGKRVNTEADEFDLALAPDGLRLYFASDRANSPAKSDLYVVRRPAADGPWGEATALLGVNTAASNERSPLVSPDGAFLYFSSDRPARLREPVNLDLYRARLPAVEPGGGTLEADDPGTGKPENMGTGVNTSADESGPALSADGFALVLASNRAPDDDARRFVTGGLTPPARQGGNRAPERDGSRRWAIYRSTAAEVEPVTAWDTSHWQAFTVVWWKALAVTLLLAALAALVRYSRGWLFEAASMARFLFASLLLHALIVGLLLLVPLSQEIAERVREIRVSQAAEMFEDAMRPSQAAEAYERVADLRSVDTVAVTDLTRQIVQPPSVPLPSDVPAPTLAAELAARLPPNRVIFVPPPRVAPAAEPAEIRSRETAMAPRPAEIEPLPVEPPPGKAMPDEPPLDRKVEFASTAPAVIPALTPPRMAHTSLELSIEPAELDRDMTDMLPKSLADAPLEVSEARRAPVPRSAEPLVPEADIPMLAGQAVVESPLPIAETRIGRTAETQPSPRQLAMLAPRIAAERAAAPLLVAELPVAGTGPLSAMTVPRRDARTVISPASETPDDVKLVSAAPAPGLDSLPADVDKATVERRNVPAPAPRQAAAVADFARVHVMADKPVEIAPSPAPAATRLQRPQARATPVAYAQDNIGMQAMFALRQGDTRREFIELVGGTDQSEAGVKLGLNWLAQHQHADGHWSLHQLDPPEKKLPATSGAGGTQSDSAATGFGLLPFLASGHTHKAGDYQTVVAQAVRWLTEHQKPTGDLFVGPPSTAHMYSHGIAAIALCEAYGLSQDAALREPAQRALSFIVSSQNPSTGGWRYLPGEAGDTSVVGWQVMALKSGEMAGLAVPGAALELANKWIASAAGTGGSLGTFGYQGPGGSPAMTAEGMLCRQFLGARRNEAQMRAGANYLSQNLPQPGRETSYYWYYATQVMYHMQGDYWSRWNEHLRDMLVASQIKDGHQAGTWDPHDQWEKSGGRLYATSLRLLMLEVYYRHLPLYQQLED